MCIRDSSLRRCLGWKLKPPCQTAGCSVWWSLWWPLPCEEPSPRRLLSFLPPPGLTEPLCPRSWTRSWTCAPTRWGAHQSRRRRWCRWPGAWCGTRPSASSWPSEPCIRIRRRLGCNYLLALRRGSYRRGRGATSTLLCNKLFLGVTMRLWTAELLKSVEWSPKKRKEGCFFCCT